MQDNFVMHQLSGIWCNLTTNLQINFCFWILDLVFFLQEQEAVGTHLQRPTAAAGECYQGCSTGTVGPPSHPGWAACEKARGVQRKSASQEDRSGAGQKDLITGEVEAPCCSRYIKTSQNFQDHMNLYRINYWKRPFRSRSTISNYHK